MAGRQTLKKGRQDDSGDARADTASAETKLNAYAESIGAAIGNLRNHIDDWNGQRAHLVAQLSSMVSDAQALLAEVGHTATEQVKRVRRGRKPRKFAAPDANPAGGMKREHRPKKEKVAKSQRPVAKRARTPQSPRS